ncbi:MAG: hypothetical protein IJP07_02895 [Firmicutes bacterium]|nr:hypothetical protein [Bacillota bacterium]
MQFYANLALVAIIALFMLMQWFLSLRPGRGWGLVMPLIFLIMLIISQLQCINDMFGFLESSMGIVFNDTAYAAYTKISLIGLGLSLALYGLGCWYLHAKHQYLARRRAQRLAAKQAAQAREQEQSFHKASIDGDFSSFFNSPKGE